MEVKMQEWQWNIVKEVLYDYLDEYDHREDVREVLIKVNEQVITCKEAGSRGSIIVFPSFYQHKISPITKGVRNSLVMWTLGKPFK